MKILQLVQKPQLRGAEIFASQLSGHLQKAGHEVRLVSLFGGQADLPFDPLESLHVKGGPLGLDWPGLRKLASLINDWQPDVVQCNAADTVRYGALCQFFLKKKPAFVYRNASKVSLYIKSDLKAKINTWFAKKMDAVASVSHECRKDFISTYGYQSNKVETIPIGLEQIEKQEWPADVPQKGQTKLVHIGGFTFEKNHQGLLRIFAAVANKKPEKHLYLIGDGPLRQEIEETIDKLNLQESVSVLGYRKDIRALLPHMDALLLPSIIEGLPGVLLEAMYMQVPTVAYNVGVSEIVKQDETGFLVEKDDEDTFAAMLIKLVENQGDVKEMVVNAKQMVEAEYMNAQLYKKFLDLYHRYIDHK